MQDDAATPRPTRRTWRCVSTRRSAAGSDVQALGIAPGDYVCYDPKTVIITESGFVKSRFLTTGPARPAC
ncbi:MAG: hypothetical protein ACLUEK_09370 [Oscillospiraceae bacterium]